MSMLSLMNTAKEGSIIKEKSFLRKRKVVQQLAVVVAILFRNLGLL
jgi:hypothetical protein